MKVTNNNRWEPHQTARSTNVGTAEWSTNPDNAQYMATHALVVESRTTSVECAEVYRDKTNRQVKVYRQSST